MAAMPNAIAPISSKERPARDVYTPAPARCHRRSQKAYRGPVGHMEGGLGKAWLWTSSGEEQVLVIYPAPAVLRLPANTEFAAWAPVRPAQPDKSWLCRAPPGWDAMPRKQQPAEQQPQPGPGKLKNKENLARMIPSTPWKKQTASVAVPGRWDAKAHTTGRPGICAISQAVDGQAQRGAYPQEMENHSRNPHSMCTSVIINKHGNFQYTLHKIHGESRI